MLVLHDDARHELRLVRVKEAIGEDAVIAPADRDAAIGVLAHERDGPAEPAIVHGILEHVEPALVVDGELGADPTRFLEGEDPGELLRRVQRAVGIVRRAGWLGEARVVIGHEGGQERLAAAMLESPRSRSSFTRRSCRVPFARSTRLWRRPSTAVLRT